MTKRQDILHVCIHILGTGTGCRVGKFGSTVLVLVLVRKFARVEVPVSLIAHVAFGGRQVAIKAAVEDLVVSL